MAKLPVVAIVGRPNVGKSSLLNALVRKRVSIVEDVPGVTRDRVSIPLYVDGRFVELVDTGGYGFVDPDALTDHIHHQIELAMSRANLVLFIVDCQDGLTAGDEAIASLLRKHNVKTVLLANKADGERADVSLADFSRLGLGTPVGVSALNHRNLDQVHDAIRDNLDLSNAPTDMPEPAMYVAIVGKRNAGKSTLVNSIARIFEDDTDRVIVSEVPGTTRDSIDVRFEKDGQTLVVIDTAGVRKKKHIATHDLEFYGFHRAQRSIRRADVVLLLIDATDPVSEPDRKLSQYIMEQHKPIILVINKWDKAKVILREQRKDTEEKLQDSDLMEEYREYLDAELPHVNFAPIAFTTAKDGRNVQAVLDLSANIFKQATQRISTGKLNQVVRKILQERLPSTPSGRRPRIYYATQIAVSPPTIVLFVNKPQYLDEAYQRFILNRFRELLPYAEVPIRLIIRARQEKGASMEEEQDTPAPPPPRQSRPKSPARKPRHKSARNPARKSKHR